MSANPRLPGDVPHYLAEGCGRCPLGGTPDCKVHTWTKELEALRSIVLGCGLSETIKWGVPCYTWKDKNVLIISAFKEYCAISFFKGSLLQDSEGILDKPGENSQAARLIRITALKQVAEQEDLIKNYVFEAIEVEKAGLEVAFKSIDEFDVPAEFRQALDADPALNAAYQALTPGRQRSYLHHIGQAKQSQTRLNRIEKCIPRIMEGKGFLDR